MAKVNEKRRTDNEGVDFYKPVYPKWRGSHHYAAEYKRLHVVRFKRYKKHVNNGLDPPLPIPELTRDEFNAYKRTLLQEHLYELIFKESQSSSTASNSLSLMELPSLGPSSENNDLSAHMQVLETSGFELIAEVHRSCSKN